MHVWHFHPTYMHHSHPASGTPCGSQAKHVDLKRMGNAALFDLVDAVVCGDDPRVQRGKPHPDIYLAAAARIGVDPTR